VGNRVLLLKPTTYRSAPFLNSGTHELVTKPPTGKEKALRKRLHARVPEDPAVVSKIRKRTGTPYRTNQRFDA
jgi:hypothetical protein